MANSHATLSPSDLDKLPGRVLAILIENRAQGNHPIKSRDIARRVLRFDATIDVSLAPRATIDNMERRVRLAILQLLKQGHLIVSSVNAPMGYYIGTTQADLDACVAHRLSRVRENLVAVRWLLRNGERTLGQQLTFDQLLANLTKEL